MKLGDSLTVQWLRLSVFTAEARVQSLVRELKMPQAAQQKKKEMKLKRNVVDHVEDFRCFYPSAMSVTWSKMDVWRPGRRPSQKSR